MTLTIEKKGRKDERLAIRLPKRTKFALDRYSQRHEMSASSVINQVLKSFLTDPSQEMVITSEGGREAFFGDACWDPLTPDRFLKIATLAPEFLSESEQVRWKIICEDRQYFDADGELNRRKVRDNWNEINKQERELLDFHG